MTQDWAAVTHGRRALPPPPLPGATPQPPPVAAVPAARVDESAGAEASSRPPKRLSWYMRAADHALMTRMRDELYHAAGAENPELGKQDAEGALARAIAADFAAIKHRALLDLLGKETT